MDATKGNIYSILNGNKQFLIPVYQRYYSWDLEQCRRLWNDIVDMQKKNKQGHFVGSIVNIAEQAMPTGVQKYMIIDGQQRITTLTLLLIALRNYANTHIEDTSINARRIDNMLLKNEYESGDERYKLLLTENDRDILIRLVEEKPISEDIVSRLLTNYGFFLSQIEKLDLQPAEVYESIGKLQIVNITLDRAVDDAQAIFESLNSTGKELSESDLIRNYILMGLDNIEQSYVYEHLWRPMELLFEYEKQDSVMDRFFRDYITMKICRIPKIDKVYSEFKSYHVNCEFASIRELCQDLLTYATYYTNMVFERSKDKKLKALYADINDLRMEVAFPFLLKVHNDCTEGIITEADLKEIIQMCISYVFRRNVCDIPTNSLNKTFATLRNEVKLDDYLNSIKAFFILRDDYKQFPNDEWKKELGPNWKDVQKTYLHTIGNLTLTAYNSEMSDKPFIEKLEMTGGFKESALRLNAYLVKLTEWNEAHIKERAFLLAKKANEVWAYPQLTPAELKPYTTEDKPEEKYSLETYDTNVFTKTLFHVLDKRIMNLSSDVRREYKKLYVAYKMDTNFVDIVFQKQRLRISINMKYSQVYDPKGLCKDITGLGRWGNGDIELFMEHTADVDDVMEIIDQSYRLQVE